MTDLATQKGEPTGMTELTTQWHEGPGSVADLTTRRTVAQRRRGVLDRSDIGLVVDIIGGDHDALAAVYHRHGAAVHATARRLCGSTLAEDVVQEVFVALWRRPEAFDPGRGSLRSYLRVVAHSRAVDVVRSEVARSSRENATPPNAPDRFVVESETLANHVGGEVRSRLAELPDATRQAIVLAYFCGHTYRQVAELLDQPEGTVKSRIRSGLTYLRAILLDEAHPSNGAM